MDFHILTPIGSAHILTTNDRGEIVTPLPATPPAPIAAPTQPAPTK